ncbi:hypothetical protein [Streptomyces sp. NPDC058745]|uniref:hypothetical protein n=1 Tax=Streptomyces sp. NPDC058745 TaxID=3346621 RepID=UPI0036AE5F1B
MAYMMTEEYASAMVTVVPVILLIASLEFSTILKRWTMASDAEWNQRGVVFWVYL